LYVQLMSGRMQCRYLFWFQADLAVAAGALPCCSYPGHMYVAAHIWQLQKIKGFAAAAAAGTGGGKGGAGEGAAGGYHTPTHHSAHNHPLTPQQQQQQQQQQQARQPGTSSHHSHSRSQQQQQQQGSPNDFRLYVSPDAAKAPGNKSNKSNNVSRRPATANTSHGATEDLAAELLDTESDTASLISSLTSDDEVHGGRDELEYESDEEDEDNRVTAREKLGGAVFATHPHAKWSAGFRGKGAAEQQQQQETVQLNRKLLEKHDKLQQQQQQQQVEGLERQPLLGTEMPAEAAAAAGDATGMESAAAEDAEDEEADTPAAAAITQQQQQQQQQLLGNDAEMEAATGAGALSGFFAGCTACNACASAVRLVVPLHSSAFNYRPTRSVMRRRRLMMQQVGLH
jgi:hypothetical protein